MVKIGCVNNVFCKTARGCFHSPGKGKGFAMPNQTYLNAVQTTRNGSRGVITATRYELIEVFSFGEKVVEKYLNYGTGNQRVQTYQYYTDIADYGYGKVSQKIDYDGKWTKYEYDSAGRIIKETSPFGDAAITASENQCQVVAYEYAKLDSSESSDSSDSPRWRTKITTLCGQETAREFRQFYSNKEVSIIAVKPNVAFTDESNRVQTTTFSNYYDQFCGENIQRETKIENPDGTVVEVSYIDSSYYNSDPSQTIYTTQKTSIKKFQGNNISKEVELKNHFGTIESYRRYDLTGDTELLVEGYDQTVDRHGRPLVKTDVDGLITSYEYYQEQVTDGTYTNSIPFDHVKTTKPDGSVLIEAYDNWKNKIFELYDGIKTTYHYDAYDNMIETVITGRNGGTLTTSTAYNDDNVKTSETDANGNVTTYTYGPCWEATTDALNNVFKNEYFLDGRIKNVKVNGAVKDYYTYEIIGNELIEIKHASEAEWEKTVMAFDGNVRQKSYPDGYVQSFVYDEFGRQTCVEDNCNNKTESIYSLTTGDIFRQWRNGVLTEFASGHAADAETDEIYQYDRSYSFYQGERVLISETRTYRSGLKTREFDSGNVRIASKKYNGNGETKEHISENGVETNNVYQNERINSAENKTNGMITYAHDEFNRDLGYDYTEDDIDKSIRYALDDNGNILSMTQSAGEQSRTLSYEFDALNRLKKETTPEGIINNTIYDAQGNIIELSGGVYPQKYEYDIQARLISMMTYRNSDLSSETIFEYDNRGRLKKRKYADDSFETFAYRGDGNIREIVNARGQTVRISYDMQNRMKSLQGTDIYWEFSYDYRGFLLRACNGAYYQCFGYDAYGNLTSECFSDIPKTEIAYFYDAYNRLTSYSFDKEQVHYHYDSSTGLLNKVDYGEWSFNYSRISGSNRLAQTQARHKKKIIHSAARTYNNWGDLESIGDYSYTLDSDARRVGATLPDGRAWTYSYDGYGQIVSGILSNSTTQEASYQYAYDMIGNRLTSNDNGSMRQYASNNLNQYTSINGANLTYDADGNLLSDGQFDYSYDVLNQLIAVENSTHKQVFEYDFMGRRIATELYEKDGEELKTTVRRRYIYHKWNVIAEFIGKTKDKTYIWGEDLSETMQDAGGVGGLLLECNSNGNYLPIYDGNGNIIAYKSSLGNTVATYSYDPFGNIIEHSGLNFSYNFSTKQEEDLCQLYYYGYRFYSSIKGSWATRDPLTEFGSVNSYNFTLNNPINFFDYLGLLVDCDQLRKQMQRLLQDINDYLKMEKALLDAMLDLNWWQIAQAYAQLGVSVLSGGKSLIDAARKAAAARNAAEAVKMGYAVGRNGMVHAKLLTLAERTSRGAITSSNIFKGTAAGSIAQEILDRAIKQQLNKLSDNVLIDAFLGGGNTYEALQNLASLYADKAATATGDYNKIRDRYNKCCR